MRICSSLKKTHSLLLRILFTALFVTSCLLATAQRLKPANASNYRVLAQDCYASTSQVDLDIKNVRARLLGGGDFWWDLSDPVYVIPKVDPAEGQAEVSATFASALWIGGIDATGQL